ncbi:MAG: hypothetical protein ACE5IO_06490 [Thermoplasmata archaeon]
MSKHSKKYQWSHTEESVVAIMALGVLFVVVIVVAMSGGFEFEWQVNPFAPANENTPDFDLLVQGGYQSLSLNKSTSHTFDVTQFFTRTLEFQFTSSNNSLTAALVDEYGNAYPFDNGKLAYEVVHPKRMTLVGDNGGVLCVFRIRPVLSGTGQEITEVSR